jgi:hypothetical protein
LFLHRYYLSLTARPLPTNHVVTERRSTLGIALLLLIRSWRPQIPCPKRRDTLSPQKKLQGGALQRLSHEPKGSTRATNAEIILAQKWRFVHARVTLFFVFNLQKIGLLRLKVRLVDNYFDYSSASG